MVAAGCWLHSLAAEVRTGCFVRGTLLRRHCRRAEAQMLETLEVVNFDIIPDEIVLT